jgi:hypothetical protein
MSSSVSEQHNYGATDRITHAHTHTHTHTHAQHNTTTPDIPLLTDTYTGDSECSSGVLVQLHRHWAQFVLRVSLLSLIIGGIIPIVCALLELAGPIHRDGGLSLLVFGCIISGISLFFLVFLGVSKICFDSAIESRIATLDRYPALQWTVDKKHFRTFVLAEFGPNGRNARKVQLVTPIFVVCASSAIVTLALHSHIDFPLAWLICCSIVSSILIVSLLYWATRQYRKHRLYNLLHAEPENYRIVLGNDCVYFLEFYWWGRNRCHNQMRLINLQLVRYNHSHDDGNGNGDSDGDGEIDGDGDGNDGYGLCLEYHYHTIRGLKHIYDNVAGTFRVPVPQHMEQPVQDYMNSITQVDTLT